MNDRDIRRYDRATRVVTFGLSNNADLAPDSLAREHFAAISMKISAIDLAKAGQTPDRVSKETVGFREGKDGEGAVAGAVCGV